MKKILTAFILSLLMSAVSEAATYYVATNGSDSNPGTITQPFRTVIKGVGVMRTGDKLYIRSGAYPEVIYPSNGPIPSGTSWTDAPLIAAYPGESVVLLGIGLYGSNYKYIIFDGLTLDGGYQSGDLIWIGLSAGYIRFTNVEVKGSNSAAGIHLPKGGAGHNEFLNCKVHDNGIDTARDHGFYIASPSNLVQNCRIYSNAAYGVHIYTGGAGGADGNVIRFNEIFGNGSASTQNTAGILLSDGSGNIAYDNIIYGNFGGIQISTGAPTTNAKVYNNTIYGNRYWGIDHESGSSGAVIKNNIIYQNPTAIANYGSGTIQSNNLTTDPKFVDVSANNFRLQSGSAAIDKGVDLSSEGVTTDMTGGARPWGVAYDIGAYEYGATSTTSSTSTTSTSSSTSTSTTTSSTSTSSTSSTTSASLTALKTLSPITIDGNLNEAVWSQANFVTFSNPQRSDNTVKVSVLWNDTNLYFAYDVSDKNLEAVNGLLYLDDGAELYLDTQNNKTTTMGSNDYYLMTNINGLTTSPSVTSRTLKKTGGYTMEIQIPWTAISTVPSAGKILGLLLANNDRDNGVSTQFDWLNVVSTGDYAQPNLWGNLLLSSTTIGSMPPVPPSNLLVSQ